MNNFITLDGFKYYTTVAWQPGLDIPGTLKVNLNASVNVTYGTDTLDSWQGDVRVFPDTASPPVGFGKRSDFITTLKKRTGLAFTDHYGANYTVHATGRVVQMSLSPMWDGPDNILIYTLVLTSE